MDEFDKAYEYPEWHLKELREGMNYNNYDRHLIDSMQNEGGGQFVHNANGMIHYGEHNEGRLVDTMNDIVVNAVGVTVTDDGEADLGEDYVSGMERTKKESTLVDDIKYELRTAELMASKLNEEIDTLKKLNYKSSRVLDELSKVEASLN